MSVKRMMAVDLGASGGKCFVGTFADGGFEMTEIHRFAHEGVSLYIPDRAGRMSERTVWEDTYIYRQIVEGLHAFRRTVGAELDGIGVDAWGADGAIMSADGDALGKVYCYRDHRLDDIVARVKARFDPFRVYEITGITFQFFNMSGQLLWMVENRPDLLRDGAFLLPIPALFNFYLCGSRAIDTSWASITQLMDAKRRVWSPQLIEAFGIPVGLMPPIVEPGATLGRLWEPLAREARIAAAPVLAVASHDTACAFAAAPVADPERALVISSGTWSLVGRLLPDPVTTREAFEAGFSNEGGIRNTRFLKNVMGTWPVQELRRQWTTEDGREPDWKTLNAMAEAAPPFFALLDPDDSGFVNPSDMQAAIVAYLERTEQPAPTDRGTMIRMVYEGLAMKYRYVNETIARICGKETEVVHIVGGGCKNEMLNRFTADALGLPVVAGPVDATAVGNLMMQALGLGLIASMSDAQPLIRAAFPIARYQPRERRAWDAAYERFRALIGR